MHSVQIGDISVFRLITDLLEAGYVVLRPVTELSRYDLVIDRGNGFEKVQCKTGRLKNGAVRFNTCSSMAHHGKGRRHYRGEIDFFGVYCRENKTSYLIPAMDVPRTEGCLRIDPAKNNQISNVRMAVDYMIKSKPT